MKKILLLIIALLAGCATQLPPMPKPAPIPCDMKVNGECRAMTVSEKNGAVTRGHSEDIKEIK